MTKHRNFITFVTLLVILASAAGLYVRQERIVAMEAERERAAAEREAEEEEERRGRVGLPEERRHDDAEPFIRVDTSEWEVYLHEDGGFSMLLPDYIEAGEPDDDVYCISGADVVSFVKPAGSMNLCAFALLTGEAPLGTSPREWLEEYKNKIEPMGVGYYEKIKGLRGTWEEREVGEKLWLFVEEPEGVGGEASYTVINGDGTRVVHVFLPDLLLSYGVHDAIVASIQFDD